MNGAEHWVKHTKGLKYENGEFIKHPQKSKPDMPQELTLKQYKEGASKFFSTTNSSTASFINNSSAKLYMYNYPTKMFGVANSKSGVIITWFKANDTYWNNQILKFNH